MLFLVFGPSIVETFNSPFIHMKRNAHNMEQWLFIIRYEEKYMLCASYALSLHSRCVSSHKNDTINKHSYDIIILIYAFPVPYKCQCFCFAFWYNLRLSYWFSKRDDCKQRRFILKGLKNYFIICWQEIYLFRFILSFITH